MEKIDYINNLLSESNNKKLYDKIQKEVDGFVDVVLKEEELSIEEYERMFECRYTNGSLHICW